MASRSRRAAGVMRRVGRAVVRRRCAGCLLLVRAADRRLRCRAPEAVRGRHRRRAEAVVELRSRHRRLQARVEAHLPRAQGVAHRRQARAAAHRRRVGPHQLARVEVLDRHRQGQAVAQRRRHQVGEVEGRPLRRASRAWEVARRQSQASALLRQLRTSGWRRVAGGRCPFVGSRRLHRRPRRVVEAGGSLRRVGGGASRREWAFRTWCGGRRGGPRRSERRLGVRAWRFCEPGV